MMPDICSWVAFGRAPDGDIVVLITPMRPMPDDPQLRANCRRDHVDLASVWWARRDRLNEREERIMDQWYRINEIMMQRNELSRGDEQ